MTIQLYVPVVFVILYKVVRWIKFLGVHKKAFGLFFPIKVLFIMRYSRWMRSGSVTNQMHVSEQNFLIVLMGFL